MAVIMPIGIERESDYSTSRYACYYCIRETQKKIHDKIKITGRCTAFIKTSYSFQFQTNILAHHLLYFILLPIRFSSIFSKAFVLFTHIKYTKNEGDVEKEARKWKKEKNNYSGGNILVHVDGQ